MPLNNPSISPHYTLCNSPLSLSPPLSIQPQRKYSPISSKANFQVVKQEADKGFPIAEPDLASSACTCVQLDIWWYRGSFTLFVCLNLLSGSFDSLEKFIRDSTIRYLLLYLFLNNRRTDLPTSSQLSETAAYRDIPSTNPIDAIRSVLADPSDSDSP